MLRAVERREDDAEGNRSWSASANMVDEPDGPPDDELMARLCLKDIAALEVLYDRHHQAALGLACRIARDRVAAEDIVQEAFLAVWRQPERYDPTRGSARSWLLTIVHHRAIDSVRRRRRTVQDVDATLNLIDERAEDPCEVAFSGQRAEQVQHALSGLPDEQRRAIELAFLQGRTHAEIAALMNCPLGTVKGRIRIGLNKLRSSVSIAELAAV